MTGLRLLKVTTVYPDYLRRFLAERPGLSRLPSAQQQSALLEDGFGWGDFLTRGLRALGHEAWDVVWNADSIQRAWALEHGCRRSGRGWRVEVLAAQARAVAPDVVFWEDPLGVPEEARTLVRAAVPSIRLEVGQTSAHVTRTPGGVDRLRGLDLVLCDIPGLAAELEREGLTTGLLRHAFEPRLLATTSAWGERSRAFVFCGSIGSDVHSERGALLLRLAHETPLEVFVPPTPLRGRLRRLAARVPLLGPRLGDWARPRLPAALRERLRPARYGREMFRLLGAARLGLNLHMPRYEAGNMRLFEVTGMGAALLTDRRPGLEVLFEPEREVVTYEGVEECLERARWLLDHDAERAAIARAGQARTLRDHSYVRRAEDLVRQLELRL